MTFVMIVHPCAGGAASAVGPVLPTDAGLRVNVYKELPEPGHAPQAPLFLRFPTDGYRRAPRGGIESCSVGCRAATCQADTMARAFP
jgi:hypothetical protein